MAIQTYNPTTWEDSPSSETPISAANLNNMESGISSANTALQALENAGISPDLIVDTIKSVINDLLISGVLYSSGGKLYYEDTDGTVWNLDISPQGR